MTDNTEKLEALKQQLAVEVEAACRDSDASPFERFVAEALCSDDAKSKGLVDRVWVVNLPDARKAIEAIAAWNARPNAPTPDAGWRDPEPFQCDSPAEISAQLDRFVAAPWAWESGDHIVLGVLAKAAAALARQAPAPAVQEGGEDGEYPDEEIKKYPALLAYIQRLAKSDMNMPYEEWADLLTEIGTALKQAAQPTPPSPGQSAASPQPIEGEGKQEVMGVHRCSQTDTEASASPAARPSASPDKGDN